MRLHLRAAESSQLRKTQGSLPLAEGCLVFYGDRMLEHELSLNKDSYIVATTHVPN